MIPYEPKKPTVEIPHPGNKHIKAGEVTVIVQRPSRRDRERYRMELANHEKYETAIHPVTGRPILDNTGAVRALRAPVTYPLEPTIAFLENLIRDVKGLSDKGEPWKFTPTSAKELIWFLTDELFDVPTVRDIPVLDESGDEIRKDGKPVTESKEIELAYPVYILEQMDKVPDPLAPTPLYDSLSGN